MKLVDMTPGLVYAVPANRMNSYSVGRNARTYGCGAAQQVRDGVIAVPFIIDRVGKFREKQSGACATEIVEDYHTTSVVGSFPDVTAMLGKTEPENEYKRPYYRGRRAQGYHIAAGTWPGYPNGIGVTGKRMKWLPATSIMTPADIIMPWADFLTRREERVFVVSEINAYQERHRALLAEVRMIVDPALGFVAHRPESATNLRVPSGQRLTYDHGMLIFERSFKAEIPFTKLSPAIKAKLSPLLKEMAAIQKKLECAV